MFLSYLFCPWCVYFNVLAAWYSLPYVTVKWELCFLRVGASGCQRHGSTTCSHSGRSSHAKCVRGSCPQRNRRLQKPVLLEAWCKLKTNPGLASSATLSAVSSCGACVQSPSGTRGVCWVLGSDGVPQGSLFQSQVQSSSHVKHTWQQLPCLDPPSLCHQEANPYTWTGLLNGSHSNHFRD